MPLTSFIQAAKQATDAAEQKAAEGLAGQAKSLRAELTAKAAAGADCTSHQQLSRALVCVLYWYRDAH